MFRPSALLWSLLTALPNLCSSQRIKGGSTVERDSRLNFPYQVSIGRGGDVPDINCGGSLISLRSLRTIKKRQYVRCTKNGQYDQKAFALQGIISATTRAAATAATTTTIKATKTSTKQT